MKKIKNTTLFSIILLLVGLVLTPTNIHAQKKPKSKKGDALIVGPEITADETFSGITNNTARLRAMICGNYVQHNNVKNENNKDGEYKAWYVNNGKDSVVLYSIPVGNPNKVGYWIYHSQIMTSLPDQPIYQAFEKLIEVDRDTTRSIYYEVPESFKSVYEYESEDDEPVAFKEFVANIIQTFDKLDLSTLELSKHGEQVLYIRENPLFFKGITPLMPHDRRKGWFKQDFYEVTPKGIIYSINTYEKETDSKPLVVQIDKFIKLAMIKEQK